MVAMGTSGGMGVMTADALDNHGVPMAILSAETVDRLAAVLPPFAILRNPIDITGQYFNDRELFKRAVAVIGDAPEVGAILFSLAMITEGYAEQFASEIVAMSKAVRKPIAVVWAGGSVSDGGVRTLREAGFPVFGRLGVAARALHASGTFAASRTKVAPTPLPRPHAEHVEAIRLGGP